MVSRQIFEKAAILGPYYLLEILLDLVEFVRKLVTLGKRLLPYDLQISFRQREMRIDITL